MPDRLPRAGAAPRVPATRVFFDLSTSYSWRGRPAVGIVRTERELFRHIIDHPGLHVIPVLYHDGEFRALDRAVALSLVGPVSASPRAAPAGMAAPRPRRGIGRAWLTRLARPAGRLARWAVPRLLARLPPAARAEARAALWHARQALRELVYGSRHGAAAVASSASAVDLSLVVHPTAADILFLGGLNWDMVNWSRIAALRARTGLRVASVMYDLIPMLFPQFLPAPQHGYHNCFLHMIDSSDLVFCISASTQADLARFVANSGRAPPASEVIHLGADMPAAPDPAEITDPVLRARLARGRFALGVGTLEIRKNHALLVDLWAELLARPDFDLDLVVVGMPGWAADDVVRRLRALPGFGSRVVWFQRLSDAGLSWLYEQCHVVVFPSLYEGWGLPVVEALLHGRPVIASSRGGTPEAGFGHATLLDPDDRAGWRAALLAEARASRRRVTLADGTLPSWQMTAATLARSLRRLGQCTATGHATLALSGAAARP